MSEAEKVLNLVREYVEFAEHRDDWGVPCVYTKKLRQILEMGEGKP